MFNKIHFHLKGQSPLLMHQDNFKWADVLKKWRSLPENKGKSTPGDDRSPGFTWLGSLYEDRGILVIPSDNIMSVLREGGAKCSVGIGRKTFKAQTQSGIIPCGISYDLLVDNKTVSFEPFKSLQNEENYDIHVKTALDNGFELFERRARIGQNKHIRVRPKFNNWEVEGEMYVTDEALTLEVLQTIFSFAGRYCGLCDWRPSSKQPGQFGMFSAVLKEIGNE
jgi:hypothetical protein